MYGTSVIQIPIDVYVPRIYRFLEKQYVDAFFERGELRISSFAQFRKHPDEGRLDLKEGFFQFHQEFDEARKKMQIWQSGRAIENAYILCGTTSNNGSNWHRDLDDCICIDNPMAFMEAVARHVPGCHRLAHGPMQYLFGNRLSGEVTDALNVAGTNGTMSPELIEREMSKVLGGLPFFLKSADYSKDAEYRMIWLVEEEVTEPIKVWAPLARQFCTRVRRVNQS